MLSPVRLETSSQALDFLSLSNPVTSPIIFFVMEEFGKTYFISGKSTSFAYLSNSAFKKTPSSLTTGLVSQLT